MSINNAGKFRVGSEVFLIQALFFGTLWGLYDREANAYFVFAAVALTVLITLYSFFAHRQSLQVWGIQFSNLIPVLKKAVLPLMICAGICVAFALTLGEGIAWPKWTRYLEFPLAGLLQQVIFQGFFFNRYEDVFRNRLIAIFLSATTFALFHLPNAALMVVTFGTGIYAAYFFAKHRNIFIVGLLHGWISLMLTMTLEPAGLIPSYRVGPEPMGPLKKEIHRHLTPDARIAEYMPSRGVDGSFQKAFGRQVDSFKIPHRLDSFLEKEGLAFVAMDKSLYEELVEQLRISTYVWDEYYVWLRKFPKRRSRTLKCVLTLNFSQLKDYYREPVVLVANQPRP